MDNKLHRFIREFMPRLEADQRAVALEIYRGIAESATISPAQISRRTALEPSQIEAIVGSWPGVYRDGAGNIVGFWGLTAQAVSKHELRFNGQTRYAWCAWDCLFLPALLGQR